MRARRQSGDPGGSTLVLSEPTASRPPLERDVRFWLAVLLVLVLAAVVGGWLGLRARPQQQVRRHQPAAAASSVARRPVTTTQAEPTGPPASAIGSVAVPDVSGEKLPDARRAMRDAGLAVDQQEVASSAPKHTIVGQSPRAGATAAEGDHVLLIVSAGLPKEHGPHGKDREHEHPRNQ